jgi:hypothetical protein
MYVINICIPKIWILKIYIRRTKKDILKFWVHRSQAKAILLKKLNLKIFCFAFNRIPGQLLRMREPAR